MGLPVLANDCGFGFPAVATRISHYIEWIDSVIFPKAAKEPSELCVLPSGKFSTCKVACDCPQLAQYMKSGESKLSDYICPSDDNSNLLVCCPTTNNNDKKYTIESKF